VGDQSFQEKCFDTFDRFRAENKTIVFVSHDLDAVRRFCDRVLLLEYGKPVKIGGADEVVAAYEEDVHRAVAP
jgi:lipopolysaccharide transport system ATP-binding protein